MGVAIEGQNIALSGLYNTKSASFGDILNLSNSIF